jgi:hypothetical protein
LILGVVTTLRGADGTVVAIDTGIGVTGSGAVEELVPDEFSAETLTE